MILDNLLGIISLGAILILIIQRYKGRNIELQKAKLELSHENLSLEKKALEQKLEFRNKELTTNVMYLMKKNELLNDISTWLIALKKDLKNENASRIQKIILDINRGKDEDAWEEFEIRFHQVYNDFYERLLAKHPDLSLNERKLCAFLKLNLTSKEICTITGQTINGLNVARARLRKKMGLDSDDNLSNYLSAV